MKIQNIANAVTSKIGRQGLKLQKSSPTIMFVGGVVGVVATVVLASKATLQLEEILDEHDVNMSKAKGLHASDRDDYSDDDFRKDKVIITARTATTLVKAYGPAFLVGAASIGLLTGSHVTLNRRNAATVAAYAAVDKAFKEYRDRVLADVGPEKEREYYSGTESREVYSETKKGEPKVEEIKTSAGKSPYAVLFDNRNPNWNPEAEHTLFFLKLHQNQLNMQLQARGHVFLNDVFDALGMDRTSAGAVVGWVKDNKNGDGYVDFGIWDDDNMEKMLDFVTGRENCIWLDFNVDGIVYDLI